MQETLSLPQTLIRIYWRFLATRLQWRCQLDNLVPLCKLQFFSFFSKEYLKGIIKVFIRQNMPKLSPIHWTVVMLEA